jgi:acetyl-CoA carboxylase biotin carboxyl carrier protein
MSALHKRKRGIKVADDAPKTPTPFDLRTVKALVALMGQHDLSEIDLHDGPQRIRLRRGARKAAAAPTVILPTPAPLPTAPPPAAVPKTDAAPSPPPTKKLVEVKSPTPGTFYAASTPGAQPYVSVGSKVTLTSVVCMIEAMKIFNEITADCSGTVVEILVENQQAVEYGQVLFRVDPTG